MFHLIKYYQLIRNNEFDLVSNKIYNGIVLIALFTIFSLTYVNSVISPQFGWWQYYAWRMECGDVLYKDIYLFMPPYFVFLTHLFYTVFDNHFILYTWLVGFPVKVISILLLYNVVCRITKPVFACFCVLFGACMSATYPMDMLYDYNPITILPCLLVAFLCMRYYEQLLKGQPRRWTSLWIGVILAVLFGLKQTFGITFIFTIGVAFIAMYYREKMSFRIAIKDIAWFVGGVVIGLLPAIWYLTYHHVWGDFFRCLAMISEAKGGTTYILLRCFKVLDEFKIWVYALVVYTVLYVLSRYSDNHTNIIGRWSQWNIRNANKWLVIIFFILAVAIILYTYLPHEFHFYMSFDRLVFKWRQRVCRVLVYSGVFIWLLHMLRYVLGKKTNAPIVLFTSLIAAHFFTGVLSTDALEEIYFVIYLPWVLALVLGYNGYYKTIKDSAIFIVMLFFGFSCVSFKQNMPYSWQGWTTLYIDKSDVYSSIRGLEGLRMSTYAEKNFQKVVNLIEENCDKDDKVFQFANIPLFNVLTKHKISDYAPITWFDVCSDSLAHMVAKEQIENPPKMVIWHRMDKTNWKIVEEVFRNGKKSGQRELQKFHDQVIKKKYKCLKFFYNNRDGAIEVWLRKD